jgi:hypothetical protein
MAKKNNVTKNFFLENRAQSLFIGRPSRSAARVRGTHLNRTQQPCRTILCRPRRCIPIALTVSVNRTGRHGKRRLFFVTTGTADGEKVLVGTTEADLEKGAASLRELCFEFTASLKFVVTRYETRSVYTSGRILSRPVRICISSSTEMNPTRIASRGQARPGHPRSCCRDGTP